MIDHQILATRLTAAAKALEDHGKDTWQRVHDWTTTGRMPAAGIRGGGLTDPDAGELDDRQAERAEDRKAARYQTELTALTTRLDADLARLRVIIGVACPDGPAAFATSDMLAAQVAADGYCANCWTYEQGCYEREKDSSGAYYDRNYCRRCVRFRNDEGVLPPFALLRIWRGLGRRTWTTAEVESALSEARKPKSKNARRGQDVLA